MALQLALDSVEALVLG
jgi:hypothetical protein